MRVALRTVVILSVAVGCNRPPTTPPIGKSTPAKSVYSPREDALATKTAIELIAHAPSVELVRLEKAEDRRPGVFVGSRITEQITLTDTTLIGRLAEALRGAADDGPEQATGLGWAPKYGVRTTAPKGVVVITIDFANQKALVLCPGHQPAGFVSARAPEDIIEQILKEGR